MTNKKTTMPQVAAQIAVPEELLRAQPYINAAQAAFNEGDIEKARHSLEQARAMRVDIPHMDVLAAEIECHEKLSRPGALGAREDALLKQLFFSGDMALPPGKFIILERFAKAGRFAPLRDLAFATDAAGVAGSASSQIVQAVFNLLFANRGFAQAFEVAEHFFARPGLELGVCDLAYPWNNSRYWPEHKNWTVLESCKLSAALRCARIPKALSGWQQFYLLALQFNGNSMASFMDSFNALPQALLKRQGWMYFLPGLLQMNACDYSAALKYCELALAAKPDDDFLLCTKAKTLFCAGKRSQARACFAQARKARPPLRAEIDTLEGELLLFHGDYEEAGKLLSGPAMQGTVLAQCRYGSALLLQGKAAQAAPFLEKALELAPQDAEAHVWLGELLRVTGKTQRAEKLLRRALELESGNYWAVINMALLLAGRGERESAYSSMDKLPDFLCKSLPARPDAAFARWLKLCLAQGKGCRRIEKCLQDIWLPRRK